MSSKSNKSNNNNKNNSNNTVRLVCCDFLNNNSCSNPASRCQYLHQDINSRPCNLQEKCPKQHWKRNWVPDKTSDICQICKERSFGLFTRKHHCRERGELSCSDCLVEHPVIGKICKKCNDQFTMEALTQQQSDASAKNNNNSTSSKVSSNRGANNNSSVSTTIIGQKVDEQQQQENQSRENNKNTSSSNAVRINININNDINDSSGNVTNIRSQNQNQQQQFSYRTANAIAIPRNIIRGGATTTTTNIGNTNTGGNSLLPPHSSYSQQQQQQSVGRGLSLRGRTSSTLVTSSSNIVAGASSSTNITSGTSLNQANTTTTSSNTTTVGAIPILGRSQTVDTMQQHSLRVAPLGSTATAGGGGGLSMSRSTANISSLANRASSSGGNTNVNNNTGGVSFGGNSFANVGGSLKRNASSSASSMMMHSRSGLGGSNNNNVSSTQITNTTSPSKAIPFSSVVRNNNSSNIYNNMGSSSSSSFPGNSYAGSLPAGFFKKLQGRYNQQQQQQQQIEVIQQQQQEESEIQQQQQQQQQENENNSNLYLSSNLSLLQNYILDVHEQITTSISSSSTTNKTEQTSVANRIASVDNYHLVLRFHGVFRRDHFRTCVQVALDRHHALHSRLERSNNRNNNNNRTTSGNNNNANNSNNNTSGQPQLQTAINGAALNYHFTSVTSQEELLQQISSAISQPFNLSNSNNSNNDDNQSLFRAHIIEVKKHHHHHHNKKQHHNNNNEEEKKDSNNNNENENVVSVSSPKIKKRSDEHICIFVAHRLVADKRSLAIFFDDVRTLYKHSSELIIPSNNISSSPNAENNNNNKNKNNNDNTANENNNNSVSDAITTDLVENNNNTSAPEVDLVINYPMVHKILPPIFSEGFSSSLQWDQELLNTSEGQELRHHVMSALPECCSAVVEIPTDHPRGAKYSFDTEIYVMGANINNNSSSNSPNSNSQNHSQSRTHHSHHHHHHHHHHSKSTKESVTDDVVDMLKKNFIAQSSSLSHGILAAFSALLLRYSGCGEEEEVAIATRQDMRPFCASADAVGPYTNFSVFSATNNKSHYTPGKTLFADLLGAARSHMNDLETRCVPFPALMEKALKNPNGHFPLAQVGFFSYLSTSGDNSSVALSLGCPAESRLDMGDVHISPFVMNHHNNNQHQNDNNNVNDNMKTIRHRNSSMLDLSLHVWEDNSHLRIAFEYNCDLFDTSSIVKMAENFGELLNDIAHRGIQQPVSSYSLLSANQRHQLLYTFNNTLLESSRREQERRRRGVHALVEDCAKNFGERVAICMPEGMDNRNNKNNNNKKKSSENSDEQHQEQQEQEQEVDDTEQLPIVTKCKPSLTYSELESLSNQFSRFLRKRFIEGALLEKMNNSQNNNNNNNDGTNQNIVNNSSSQPNTPSKKSNENASNNSNDNSTQNSNFADATSSSAVASSSTNENNTNSQQQQPDFIIAVCMPRCTLQFVAVLSILKAGAAYLPLDLSYPPDRLDFMLGDSTALCVITSRCVANSPLGGLFVSRGTPAVIAEEVTGSIQEYLSASASASASPLSRRPPLPPNNSNINNTNNNKVFSPFSSSSYNNNNNNNYSEEAALNAIPEVKEYSTEPLQLEISPDNLVYSIYTSGSTGKPKGVLMRHGALTNLVLWQNNYCPPRNDGDQDVNGIRTLQFSPISFDVSFQETFSTWSLGGTMVMVSEKLRLDPRRLVRCINDNNVHRLFLPFVALSHICDMYEETQELPGCLSDVITAGEQLVVSRSVVNFFEALRSYRRIFFSKKKILTKQQEQEKKEHNKQEELPIEFKQLVVDPVLHNHYGPSETHVCSFSVLRGDPTSWMHYPPIGVPVSNSQLFVLDESRQLVPQGVTGELFISGDCLGRGYLNRPELTDSTFVPVVSSSSSQNSSDLENATTSSRMYQTGDLVRMLPDGNLIYVRRKDFQVKVRGFRIELGEVEAQLSSHSSIQKCCIEVRTYYFDSATTTTATAKSNSNDEMQNNDNKEDLVGDKRIVAYVIASPSIATNSTTTTTTTEGNNLFMLKQELQQHLRSSLPDYMVPSCFIFVKTLPLTPSGKINRKALPTPTNSEFANEIGGLAYSVTSTTTSTMNNNINSSGQSASSNIVVEPSTKTEITVRAIWSEVLGQPQNSLSCQSSFFTIGGHSLSVAKMLARIYSHFHVEISVSFGFQHPTIVEISIEVDRLKKQGKAFHQASPTSKLEEFFPLGESGLVYFNSSSSSSSIQNNNNNRDSTTSVATKSGELSSITNNNINNNNNMIDETLEIPFEVRFPLTLNQQSLVFLTERNPESASVYNIVMAGELKGDDFASSTLDFNTETISSAFQNVLDRFPALRTTFHRDTETGEFFQVVHATQELDFNVIELYDTDNNYNNMVQCGGDMSYSFSKNPNSNANMNTMNDSFPNSQQQSQSQHLRNQQNQQQHYQDPFRRFSSHLSGNSVPVNNINSSRIQSQNNINENVNNNSNNKIPLFGQPLADEPTLERMKVEATRPFDLSHDSMMRVRIFRNSKSVYLQVVFHHIVTDLWSLVLVVEALQAELNNSPLPTPSPKTATMVDYARYLQMRERQAAPRMLEQWKSLLRIKERPLPSLDLPTDFPRPTHSSSSSGKHHHHHSHHNQQRQQHRGAVRSFNFSPQLSRELRNFVKSTGNTMYSVLLSVVSIALHKLSRQEEIVLGTPLANRHVHEFENTCGYFVNPCPIPIEITAEMTVAELLQKSLSTVHNVMDLQEYSYPQLADRLASSSSSSSTNQQRNTDLFQAMFIYQQPQRLGELTPFFLHQNGSPLELRRSDDNANINNNKNKNNNKKNNNLTWYSMSVPTHHSMYDLVIQFGETGGTPMSYNTTTSSSTAAAAADSTTSNSSSRVASSIIGGSGGRGGGRQQQHFSSFSSPSTASTTNYVPVNSNENHHDNNSNDENSLVCGCIEFNTNLFHPSLIDSIVSIIETITEQTMMSPATTTISQIRTTSPSSANWLVSEMNRHPQHSLIKNNQMMLSFGDVYVDLLNPKQTHFVSLFRRIAVRYGNREAVDFTFPGQEKTLTFQELDQLSDRLAVQIVAAHHQHKLLQQQQQHLHSNIISSSAPISNNVSPISTNNPTNSNNNTNSFPTSPSGSSSPPQSTTTTTNQQQQQQQPELLKGTFVGVALRRGPLLIVAELAVLKAGGAFIPLDPAYPVDRLKHMLTDSESSLVICTTQDVEKFSTLHHHHQQQHEENKSNLQQQQQLLVFDSIESIPAFPSSSSSSTIITTTNSNITSATSSVNNSPTTRQENPSRETSASSLSAASGEKPSSSNHHPHQQQLQLLKQCASLVANSHDHITGEDRIYAIYTSGSTGKPKGVVLSHRGVVNLCYSIRIAYRMHVEQTRFLLFASPSFDASALEIFVPLANASSVVMLSPDPIVGDSLARAMDAARVTHAVLPPAVLAGIAEDCFPPPSMKILVTAGEAIPGETLARWRKKVYMLNAYGPTENTVASTVCDYDSLRVFVADRYSNLGHAMEQAIECGGSVVKAPPIGRVIPNCRCYVLDENLHPCAVGVPGELVVSGPGVALGYHNLPKKTGECFLQNPFLNLIPSSSSTITSSGIQQQNTTNAFSSYSPQQHNNNNANENISAFLFKKMYKTGDLVRWSPAYPDGGVIEFAGRIDQQVKIRGYRIELGEVESAILSMESVIECAVAAKEIPGTSGKTLVAYIVYYNSQNANNNNTNNSSSTTTTTTTNFLSHNEIKKRLRASLPEYMVPMVFMTVLKLPLSPSGKIDRNQLVTPTSLHHAEDHDQQHQKQHHQDSSSGGGDGSDNNNNENSEIAKELPRTPLEITISTLFSEVLGFTSSSSSSGNNTNSHNFVIGIHDNFFEIGGHSLAAMQLVSRLKEHTGVDVAIIKVFDAPTVAALADVVRSAAGDSAMSEISIQTTKATQNLGEDEDEENEDFIDDVDDEDYYYDDEDDSRRSNHTGIFIDEEENISNNNNNDSEENLTTSSEERKRSRRKRRNAKQNNSNASAVATAAAAAASSATTTSKADANLQKRSFMLSFNQEALWFAYLHDKTSSAYNVTFSAKLSDPNKFSVGCFIAALACCKAIHPMLRARFSLRSGAATQSFTRNCFPTLIQHTWTEKEMLGGEAEQKKRMGLDAHRPLNLEQGVFVVYTYSSSSSETTTTEKNNNNNNNLLTVTTTSNINNNNNNNNTNLDSTTTIVVGTTSSNRNPNNNNNGSNLPVMSGDLSNFSSPASTTQKEQSGSFSSHHNHQHQNSNSNNNKTVLPPTPSTTVNLAPITHFTLSFHHIVMDLASMEVLIEQLRNFYKSIVTGPTDPSTAWLHRLINNNAPTPSTSTTTSSSSSSVNLFPSLPPSFASEVRNKLAVEKLKMELPIVSYIDFAEWQREVFRSQAGEQLAAYWQRHLLGAPAESTFKLDKPRTNPRCLDGGTVIPNSGALSTKSFSKIVGDGARTLGTTVATVLLATTFAWMNRITGQTDLIIGMPVAGRTRRELENVVGDFVNVLPLRIELPSSSSSSSNTSGSPTSTTSGGNNNSNNIMNSSPLSMATTDASTSVMGSPSTAISTSVTGTTTTSATTTSQQQQQQQLNINPSFASPITPASAIDTNVNSVSNKNGSSGNNQQQQQQQQHGGSGSTATFRQVLRLAKTSLLKGLMHQEYPFGLMVEKFCEFRDSARSPLFQILFVHEKPTQRKNASLANFVLGDEGGVYSFAPNGDCDLLSIQTSEQQCQFDLVIAVSEGENGALGVRMQYSASLFHHETAMQLANQWLAVTLSALASPNSPVHSISLLTPKQRQLLHAQNRSTRQDYEALQKGLCVHEIVEQTVSRYPGHPAVFDPASGISFTYSELNKYANILGRKLRNMMIQMLSMSSTTTVTTKEEVEVELRERFGASTLLCEGAPPLPNTTTTSFSSSSSTATTSPKDREIPWPIITVAFLLQRSVYTIVCMLAAAKAGVAYVPIDIKAPVDRILYILENSGSMALLYHDASKQVLEALVEHHQVQQQQVQQQSESSESASASASPTTTTTTTNFPQVFNVEQVIAEEKEKEKEKEAEEDNNNNNTNNNISTSLVLENSSSSSSSRKLSLWSPLYMIFTSGSTGLPKGVVVHHGGLVSVSTWFAETHKIKPGDISCQALGAAFDPVNIEVWPYLFSGASINIMDDNTKLSDSQTIVDYLHQHKVTHITFPTVLSAKIFEEAKFPKGFSMKSWSCGGDKFSGTGKRALTFSVINAYGPTEASVLCSQYCVNFDIPDKALETPRGPDSDRYSVDPPIGRPTANTALYVLDEYGRLCPPGMVGELCVAGSQVAIGYHQNPTATSRVFVRDPFFFHSSNYNSSASKNNNDNISISISSGGEDDENEENSSLLLPEVHSTFALRERTSLLDGGGNNNNNNNNNDIPGFATSVISTRNSNINTKQQQQQQQPSRMYKTGDLVRYDGDFNLHFVGRKDFQVKIRGFRIELGEIETQLLLLHDLVLAAQVIVYEGSKTHGEKRLFAFVVPKIQQQQQQEENDTNSIFAEQTTSTSRDVTSSTTTSSSSSPKLFEKNNSSCQKQRSQIRRELHRELKSRLPEYMVPVFVLVSHFPLTPNGKVDRARLEVPDADGEEYERVLGAGEGDGEGELQPRNEVEKVLCDLWCDILGVKSVSPRDNWYSRGGSSLTSTVLISRVKQLFDIVITLQQFFASPTVEGLAKVIGAEGRSNVVDNVAETLVKDANALDSAISASKQDNPDLLPYYNNISCFSRDDENVVEVEQEQEQEVEEPTGIFVTGVTGFLGCFLAYELLRETTATLYCLVRAHTETEGMRRIFDTFQKYKLFDISSTEFETRVVAVVGDLARPYFGLSQQRFDEVAQLTQTVIHCGAFVNFGYPYSSLKNANVDGTVAALRLATTYRLKSFHHISTLSVLPDPDDDDDDENDDNNAVSSNNNNNKNKKIVSERRLPAEPSENLHGGYTQSKWVAEQLVWLAHDRGVPVTIHRPGRITGHSKTGATNNDDFLNLFVKGCLEMKSVPLLDEMPCELTPVDFCAQAIIRCSLRHPQSALQGHCFHITNTSSIPWSRFFHIMREEAGFAATEIEALPYQKWREEKLLKLSGESHNALLPLVPSFGTDFEDEVVPLDYTVDNLLQDLNEEGTLKRIFLAARNFLGAPSEVLHLAPTRLSAAEEVVGSVLRSEQQQQRSNNIEQEDSMMNMNMMNVNVNCLQLEYPKTTEELVRVYAKYFILEKFFPKPSHMIIEKK